MRTSTLCGTGPATHWLYAFEDFQLLQIIFASGYGPFAFHKPKGLP